MTESAARTLNAARRLGYRVLPGEGFSYVLHLRPREWPIMAAHTSLGFVLATTLPRTLQGLQLGALSAGLGIWVVLLNGGTLALNSAFDRDEGDIGYLDAPPPPPRHLGVWSIGLMALGQGLALLMPAGFTMAYVICFAMSLLYSVPPARLKAVAGADWVINMLGFGSLTPYAGWASTGRPLTHEAIWVLVAFCPLMAALYPLTQIYQFEEDRRRGDRTLALMLGIRGSLVVSIGAAALAFACFARAALLHGAESWQWGALAVAAVSWASVLLPWLARARGLPSKRHQRGMYAALTAWAITDVAVVLAFAM